MQIRPISQNIFDNSFVKKYPCISYYGMKKSARIMRDILLFYFPIYNLNVNDFFKNYPILGFIEALVYQADIEIEAEQQQKITLQQTSRWQAKKNIILLLLKELQLKHWSIDYYIDKLGEFYNLETKLMTSQTFIHTDISQINELRSSDYRVLHSLLIQSLGKTYEQTPFDVMWPIEVVTEIYDDIYSYKSDVVAGNFNTYALFVKLYEKEAPKHLEAEMNHYEKLFDDYLNKLPLTYQRVYSFIWSQMQQIYPRPEIPQPILKYSRS